MRGEYWILFFIAPPPPQLMLTGMARPGSAVDAHGAECCNFQAAVDYLHCPLHNLKSTVATTLLR